MPGLTPRGMPYPLPTEPVAEGAQAIRNLAEKVAPALVSTLPATPYDGQEVYYVADAAAGIVWHLCYRAASPSAYKWEFLGGPPLFSFSDLTQSTASSSYGGFVPQVEVTVPRAGDYDLAFGCSCFPNTATVENLWMTVKLGALAASDADGKYTFSHAANEMLSMEHALRRNLPAGALVQQQYRSTAGGVANFTKKWLRVTPVRLTAAATKDIPDADHELPELEPDPEPVPDPPPAGSE